MGFVVAVVVAALTVDNVALGLEQKNCFDLINKIKNKENGIADTVFREKTANACKQ